MAGMGPAPKPDGERVRRHAPTFSWLELPAEGRKGKPPKLPTWRVWHPRTEDWWTDLWRKPQAVAWQQDGSTLHVMAALMDDLISGRAEASKISAEIRQHELTHGLNPKAMLQLRWRIMATEAAPAPATKKAAARKGKAATVTPLDDRRARVAQQLAGKEPR